ncbi:alpha/beta fold hydrolase [Pseudonocardia pini]|uniref:alpha/beta fold hydrolase n=1 Tax=Pseudonocardia pini TaxID=2758030 RepID=UPI0015F05FC6|nr:alpha/beta hydrolase [Pseudonocardia pini]
MEATRVTVVGGRRVAWTEHGDPGGRLVVFLHGIPDSRLGKSYLDAAARERGLRVVCPDRPGIGRSDPLPDHTVAGYAGQVAALARALGADRYGVLGYSGGGPFALACAAGADPHLTAVTVVAGLGPLDREGARAGVGTEDLDMIDLARHRPWLGALVLRGERLAVRLAPGFALRLTADGLTAHDRAMLDHVGGELLLAGFAEALRPGPRGVLAEYALLGAPWELDWKAVAVPVHLVAGEDDRTVPLHHAEDVLARLPADVGTLHRIPDAGHVSVVRHLGAVLDTLAG